MEFQTGDEQQRFKFASVALLAFVQANFTGPDLNFTPNVEGSGDLMVDGEEINVNVKWPELLVISEKLFKELSQAENFVSC